MAKSLQEVLQFFGPLDDAGGADSARERFRRYLRDEVFTPELLHDYVNGCESLSGLQRIRAMQDIINRTGELLGFHVIHGRYHGDNGPVTIDGHWRSDSGRQYLIEARAGEMTPPDPGRLRNFARLLHMAGKLPELHTITGIYVADRTEVETGNLQRGLLETPGEPALRVVSVGSLIRLYELIRASEVSHEDVDQILSEGGVDIDSSIIAMNPPSAGEGSLNAEVQRERAQTPAAPPVTHESVQTTRPRSMEEVSRLLEEINQPGRLGVQQTQPPAASTEAASDRNAVTRKKDIQLAGLPPRQSIGNAPPAMSGMAQQATATALAEDAAPGFNATLNDTRMNMMPELPEDSWRDSLTKDDEQMFDAISGARKKPFINVGLGRKNAGKPAKDVAKTPAEKSADGIFSGIFSGLGRPSKREKAQPASTENFEQVTIQDLVKPDAGNRVDRQPEILQPEVALRVESAAPAQAEETPAPRTAPEAPHIETPAPSAQPGQFEVAASAAGVTTPPIITPPPVSPSVSPSVEEPKRQTTQSGVKRPAPEATTGQPASLEKHDALMRIVGRLWPYPEFRDYAVDVFTCGAKAHDLERGDVEELLSLVELHSRRK